MTDWISKTGRKPAEAAPSVGEAPKPGKGILRLVFRSGRERSIRYRHVGDIEYYPRNGSQNGYDMEAVAFTTLDDRMVVKGYNLRTTRDRLENGTIPVIKESAEPDIRQRRRTGEAIYVTIESKPLLYEDGPDIPDFLHYFDTMPVAPGMPHAAPVPH